MTSVIVIGQLRVLKISPDMQVKLNKNNPPQPMAPPPYQTQEKTQD